MIVDLTYETISHFLQQESVIEYDIYEMHNKEFLIYFETPCKNNVSLITDNWDEIVKKFY
jgi:hypothetical protein